MRLTLQGMVAVSSQQAWSLCNCLASKNHHWKYFYTLRRYNKKLLQLKIALRENSRINPVTYSSSEMHSELFRMRLCCSQAFFLRSGISILLAINCIVCSGTGSLLRRFLCRQHSSGHSKNNWQKPKESKKNRTRQFYL